MAVDFFCLELGDNFIRVADAEIKDQKVEFSSLGSVIKPIPFFINQNQVNIDSAAKAIEKLVADLKIQKKAVNIIIPDTYTYSQILTMPYLKEKELLSAIKYQADQFIPLPLDEATLDLDIIYEDPDKKSSLILIVAAPQNLIDLVGRVVEMAGLIPQNIENEISVFGRMITTFFKNNSQKLPLIFINFSDFSTSLYYYNPQLNIITNTYNYKIGHDLFSREVQVNYNFDKTKADDVLKTIGMAKGGSIDLQEILKPAFNEFAVELEKFITSIKEKEKSSNISRLFTVNLASQINYFDKSIENRLGIPTLPLDLSPFVKPNSFLNVFKQTPSSLANIIGGNIK